MSAYVRRELRVSIRADCSQKYQIMPKNTQNIPLSIPRKTPSGHLPCLQSETGQNLKCLQKGRFCLQYRRFLANMFAISTVCSFDLWGIFMICIKRKIGCEPRIGFVQKKNSVPSKSLILRCFRASPARFERAAFRLGGGPSIQLRYGDVLSFLRPGSTQTCRRNFRVLR